MKLAFGFSGSLNMVLRGCAAKPRLAFGWHRRRLGTRTSVMDRKIDGLVKLGYEAVVVEYVKRRDSVAIYQRLLHERSAPVDSGAGGLTLIMEGRLPSRLRTQIYAWIEYLQAGHGSGLLSVLPDFGVLIGAYGIRWPIGIVRRGFLIRLAQVRVGGMARRERIGVLVRYNAFFPLQQDVCQPIASAAATDGFAVTGS